MITKTVAAALIALAALSAPTSAVAQSKTQRNILDHVANIGAVTNRCPHLQINKPMILMSLIAGDIDLADKKFSGYLERKLAETTAATRKYTDDTVCMTGVVLYGPHGTNVKDAIIPADE